MNDIVSKIIWFAVGLDLKEVGLTLLAGGLLAVLFLTIVWPRRA